MKDNDTIADIVREMATEAEVIEVADQFFGHGMDTIAVMLRQAAEMRERCKKILGECVPCLMKSSCDMGATELDAVIGVVLTAVRATRAS